MNDLPCLTWDGVLSTRRANGDSRRISNALHGAQANMVTEAQDMPAHHFSQLLNCMHLMLWHLSQHKMMTGHKKLQKTAWLEPVCVQQGQNNPSLLPLTVGSQLWYLGQEEVLQLLFLMWQWDDASISVHHSDLFDTNIQLQLDGSKHTKHIKIWEGLHMSVKSLFV